MNQNMNEELFQAADLGDLARTIAALDMGADVNAPHPNLQDLPLHHAVGKGHFQVAKVLLERGAAVDAAGIIVKTPTSLDNSTNSEDGKTEDEDSDSEAESEDSDSEAESEDSDPECEIEGTVSKNLSEPNSPLVCHPLLMAAQSDRVDLVSLLLEHKATVDAKSGNGMTALMVAAEGGHVEVVAALLEHMAQVEEKDENGMTALHYGARSGHSKVVSILLEHNANVDELAKDNMTALKLAALGGHSKVVSLLLERMAAVNPASWSGNVLLEKNAEVSSAMYLAASKGHDECVNLLLTCGADLEYVDKNYYAPKPLLIAAKNGLLSTVKYLLDKGACLNPRNTNSPDALVLAAAKGHADILSFLLSSPHGDNIDIDVGDSSSTPLYDAACGGHVDCVELLLEHGAGLEVADWKGNTALMGAAEHGHAKVLSIFLERGAQVDMQDEHSLCTALMLAIINDHTEVIKLLLSRKNTDTGMLEKRDSESRTAIMHAAQRGNREYVDLLLECGADVEAEDAEGMTALMLAAYTCQFDTCKCLLDKGACIDHRDKDGMTALMLAADNVYHSYRDMRGPAGIIYRPTSCPSIKQQPCIKLLLERGADVNAVDREGETALFHASSGSVVHTLLDFGAQIDHQNMNTFTALMRFAEEGLDECVLAMCERGADLEIRTKDGYTALHVTAGSDYCDDGCLHILLHQGADISAPTPNKDNILHIAVMKYDSELLAKIIRSHPEHMKELANARNEQGFTPLGEAQRRKLVDAVRLLSEWTTTDSISQ